MGIIHYLGLGVGVSFSTWSEIVFERLVVFLSFFFFLILFVWRERGRVQAGEEQRYRDNPKQAVHHQHGAPCGTKTH